LQGFLDRVRADEYRPVVFVQPDRRIEKRGDVRDILDRQRRKQHRMGAERLQRFGEMRRLARRPGDHDVPSRQRRVCCSA
jgi:hypothetical protein